MELRIDEAHGDMDAVDLYENLREEDMLEILGLMHHPRDAVYTSYSCSTKCYSVKDEMNNLYCSFGVAPTEGTNLGSAWLLGTRRLPTIKKFFLKHSRERMEGLLDGFDYLTPLPFLFVRIVGLSLRVIRRFQRCKGFSLH